MAVCCLEDIDQAPVAQKMHHTSHRINHYPADNVVCFVNVYPLDTHLSGGQRYPAFGQLRSSIAKGGSEDRRKMRGNFTHKFSINQSKKFNRKLIYERSEDRRILCKI